MNTATNTSPQINGRTRYLSLDGLRGASTLGIVLFHYLYWNSKFFLFGLLADAMLTMFFVLSSFLITSILLRILDRKTGLWNYYIRRGLRIYPAYYVFLLLFVVLLPQVLRYPEALSTTYYTEHIAWFLTFTQNFMLLSQPIEMLSDNISLLHTWSLAVEEQFYLVWPVLLFLMPGRYRVQLFIGVILLSIGARFAYVEIWELSGYKVHAQLLSRVDAFGLGALLATVLKEGERSQAFAIGCRKKVFYLLLVSLLLMMVIGRLFNLISPMVFIQTLTGLVCVRMIYWSVTTNNWFAKAMKVKWLILLGKISYSWYLVHFPIMWVVMEYMSISERGLENFLLGFVVYVVISFVVAVLLWLLIEKPFYKLKSKFTYH